MADTIFKLIHDRLIFLISSGTPNGAKILDSRQYPIALDTGTDTIIFYAESILESIEDSPLNGLLGWIVGVRFEVLNRSGNPRTALDEYIAFIHAQIHVDLNNMSDGLGLLATHADSQRIEYSFEDADLPIGSAILSLNFHTRTNRFNLSVSGL
jgi:hypothetical protein